MTGRVDMVKDGPTARIQIANPGKRNAISTPMWHGLALVAQDLARDPKIRLAVISSEGGAIFSAGADISEFDSQRASAQSAQAYDDLVESTCALIEDLPMPTIAAITGFCFGAGASLAASCDFRIARGDTLFAVPAAKLGIGYDPRGIRRFVRVFGLHGAKRMVMLAERLPATRALELGAVDFLADHDAFEQVLDRLIGDVLEHAPMTLRAAKMGLRATADRSLDRSAQELKTQADASQDAHEGRAAFREKRAPKFRGQ